MLTGYVFAYASEELNFSKIRALEHVHSVLNYGNNEYALHGKDREFADWVYAYDGHIVLSRALLVGDRTQIVDGPLKTYEGNIVKINKHKGQALVEVSIGDTPKRIWMYFEWLKIEDGKLVKLRENS